MTLHAKLSILARPQSQPHSSSIPGSDPIVLLDAKQNVLAKLLFKFGICFLFFFLYALEMPSGFFFFSFSLSLKLKFDIGSNHSKVILWPQLCHSSLYYYFFPFLVQKSRSMLWLEHGLSPQKPKQVSNP